MKWEPIPLLSPAANTLFAEEWACLDWMIENPDAPEVEIQGVLDMLISLGRRIENLGQGIYK